eukprot:TRINITY_DN11252_c0_g1_i1.p1 TRINITY_DN11252_c0_g1~~TRINITY_DN11252_c0_g1_i1.p1  ORF type:complete len:456 (-),score=88.94 TRINITY_DN11252_c0_g1_i1:128-1495(-)
MVKLNVSVFRYLSNTEFRVLTAIEMGMKNHEYVPKQLINSLARLRYGGTIRSIKVIHKQKLVYHNQTKYDGYKLTYSGYDFLALKALTLRGIITSVGKKIGVGKESDIYIALSNDKEVVIKFHRLGRVSFRSIKNNRDYLKNRKHASWLYLSRLAALKEFAMMKALYDNGFPVPKPIDVNRHCVVMEIVKGYPLANIKELANPEKVYNKLMNIIVLLAKYGLIHGDFNEFNIMVGEDEEITIIDFPQMVSTDHPNAKMYFDRDVECLKIFFRRRFGMPEGESPLFGVDTKRERNLDKDVEASGFNKDHAKDMEELLAEQESILKENPEAEELEPSEKDDNLEQPNDFIHIGTSEDKAVKEESNDITNLNDETITETEKETQTDNDLDNSDTVSNITDTLSTADIAEIEDEARRRKIANRVKKQIASRERRNVKLRNNFKAKEKKRIRSQIQELPF